MWSDVRSARYCPPDREKTLRNGYGYAEAAMSVIWPYWLNLKITFRNLARWQQLPEAFLFFR
jgi:hypothetical protein